MMNITQKILLHLSTLGDRTRKQSIAKALGTSESYVANSLANLVRANYVHQSKGFYNITPLGKRTIEKDPELNDFYVKPALDNKVSFHLPIKTIKHNRLCKGVSTQENVFELAAISDRLLPFVLLWLRINGVKTPEFRWELYEDDDRAYERDTFEEILTLLFKSEGLM